MKQPMCSRCNGTTEQGFLFDRSYDTYGKPADWVEGKPERSFWFGLKTSGRSRLQIVTYRCQRCGYLESYATDEKEE